MGAANSNHRKEQVEREWFPCNLCSSSQHRRLFTKRSWEIVKCIECGLVFINPRPSTKTLPSLYDGCPERNQCALIDHQKYRDKFLKRPQEYLNIVLLHKNTGRILDVGCREGSFLNRAKMHGFKVVGVEISLEAVKNAIEQFGILETEINCTTFENVVLEIEQFDAITFWDVLEHLADPTAALRKAYGLLKRDGIVVIRCPNIDGLVSKMAYYTFGKTLGYWPHPSPPHHLYEFSKSTLIALLRKVGFQMIEVLPSEIPPSCFSGGVRIVELGLCLAYRIARVMDRANSMVVVAKKT